MFMCCCQHRRSCCDSRWWNFHFSGLVKVTAKFVLNTGSDVLPAAIKRVSFTLLLLKGLQGFSKVTNGKHQEYISEPSHKICLFTQFVLLGDIRPTLCTWSWCKQYGYCHSKLHPSEFVFYFCRLSEVVYTEQPCGNRLDPHKSQSIAHNFHVCLQINHFNWNFDKQLLDSCHP